SSSYDESAFAQVGARGSLTGEVRFAERDGAETAILSLNGSLIRGCAIMVQRDDMSKDGTKLIVSNLPHGMQWQQLKDHFSPVGKVAYACIKREEGEGVGSGPGRGAQCGPPEGYVCAVLPRPDDVLRRLAGCRRPVLLCPSRV
ncbi:unnamed protein product, partial [Prorocentrum cordatum]